MGNPGMDLVQATEFYSDMYHQSHVLTTTNTPPVVPHPTTTHINYCVRAEGSLMGE